MRALLLAPHNDDETLFASFICIKYRPFVVICYRSQMQDEYDIHHETREMETSAAMDILGCKYKQWPLSDMGTTDEEVEAWMIGLRDPAGDEDWDVVFAPADEKNGSSQHNLIANLADSVFSDIQVEHYLTYTNPPLVRSRNGTEIEYEPGWVFIKHRALSVYRSQARTPSFRHFTEDIAEYLA